MIKQFYPPPPPPPPPQGEEPGWHFSPLLPPQVAREAESVGAGYAAMGILTTFALAALAGSFIALGALFSTMVATGAGEALPFGVGRLLGGLAFCMGFILVAVAGGEIFAANNLIVMALAARRILLRRLFRNWIIVFLGNLAGAVAIALLMFTTAQYTIGGGAPGLAALELATGKLELGFLRLIALGIMGNALVCLAMWLTMTTRRLAGKVLAVLFPITALAAAGFEHAVANMYLIPAALLIKSDATFLEGAGKSAADYEGLTWSAFLLDSLAPVGFGNVIGGPVLVGLIYWFIHLRRQRPRSAR